MLGDVAAHAQTTACQYMAVKGTVAKDLTMIHKDESISLFVLSHRHGIFQAHTVATVAAKQAFFVAAYAVHPANVELAGGRQIIVEATLCVQAQAQKLPMLIHFLVQAVKLVQGKILVLIGNIGMRTGVKAVLLVNNRACAVISYGIACRNAFNGIIEPMLAAEISLGILLTVIKRCLSTSLSVTTNGWLRPTFMA